MSNYVKYQRPIIDQPSRIIDDFGRLVDASFRIPFRMASLTFGVSSRVARQSFRTFRRVVNEFNDYSCQLCCYEDTSCTCSGFDFSFETRIGEIRIMNVLLENNTNKNQIVKVSSNCMMDCNGKQVSPKGIIKFSKEEIHLAPCQKVDLKIIFKIDKPLVEGGGYVGYINIERNCKIKQVCFCLHVLSDCDYDQLWLTDDCRDPKGEYIEKCCCPEYRYPANRCDRYYLSN
ncbi:MAG: hypothetical protein AAGA77_19075 [Bacteroidota bacterium]